MQNSIKKDDRKLYVVLKECWIQGKRYVKGDQIKLNDASAREWLERGCIALVKNKDSKK